MNVPRHSEKFPRYAGLRSATGRGQRWRDELRLQEARQEFELGCWNKLKKSDWYESLESLLPSFDLSFGHQSKLAQDGGVARQEWGEGEEHALGSTTAPHESEGAHAPSIGEATTKASHASREFFRFWRCCADPSVTLQPAADVLALPSVPPAPLPSPEESPSAGSPMRQTIGLGDGDKISSRQQPKSALRAGRPKAQSRNTSCRSKESVKTHEMQGSAVPPLGGAVSANSSAVEEERGSKTRGGTKLKHSPPTAISEPSEATLALRRTEEEGRFHSKMNQPAGDSTSVGLSSLLPQGASLPTPKAVHEPHGIPLLQGQGMLSPHQQHQESVSSLEPQQEPVLTSPPPETPRKPPLYPNDEEHSQELEQERPHQQQQQDHGHLPQQTQLQRSLRIGSEPQVVPQFQPLQFQQQLPPLVQTQLLPQQAVTAEMQQHQYAYCNDLLAQQMQQQSQAALRRMALPSPQTPLLVLPQGAGTPHLQQHPTMVLIQQQPGATLGLTSPQQQLIAQQQAVQHHQQQHVLQRAHQPVTGPVATPRTPWAASSDQKQQPQQLQTQPQQQLEQHLQQQMQQELLQRGAVQQAPQQVQQELKLPVLQHHAEQQGHRLPMQGQPSSQSMVQPTQGTSVGEKVPQGAALDSAAMPTHGQSGAAASAGVTESIPLSAEPHRSLVGNEGFHKEEKQQQSGSLGQQHAPPQLARYYSAHLYRAPQNQIQMNQLQRRGPQIYGQQQQQSDGQQETPSGHLTSPEIPQETQPTDVPQQQQQQQPAPLPAQEDQIRGPAHWQLQQRGRLLMMKQLQEEEQQQPGGFVLRLPPERAASARSDWNPSERDPSVQRVSQQLKEGALAAAFVAENQQTPFRAPAAEMQPLPAQPASHAFPTAERTTPRSSWRAPTPVQLQQQQTAVWAQPGALQPHQPLLLQAFSLSPLHRQQPPPLIVTQGAAEPLPHYIVPVPRSHMVQQAKPYGVGSLQNTVSRPY